MDAVSSGVDEWSESALRTAAVRFSFVSSMVWSALRNPSWRKSVSPLCRSSLSR